MQLPRAPYKAGTNESQEEAQNAMPSHGFLIRAIGGERDAYKSAYRTVVMCS